MLAYWNGADTNDVSINNMVLNNQWEYTAIEATEVMRNFQKRIDGAMPDFAALDADTMAPSLSDIHERLQRIGAGELIRLLFRAFQMDTLATLFEYWIVGPARLPPILYAVPHAILATSTDRTDLPWPEAILHTMFRAILVPFYVPNKYGAYAMVVTKIRRHDFATMAHLLLIRAYVRDIWRTNAAREGGLDAWGGHLPIYDAKRDYRETPNTLADMERRMEHYETQYVSMVTAVSEALACKNDYAKQIDRTRRVVQDTEIVGKALLRTVPVLQQRDGLFCVLCKKRKIGYVLAPCGHASRCSVCGKYDTVCPDCACVIQDLLPIT